MATHPEAFVLLHIPDVVLSASGASESGTLALECVTLAPDTPKDDPAAPLAASLSPTDCSLILVLRLGALELPLDPARPISCRIGRDGTRTYLFHGADPDAPKTPADGAPSPSAIQLFVPLPTRPDPHRAETVEALDHILAQYAEFDWQVEGGAAHHEEPEAAPTATEAQPHGPSLGTGEPAPQGLRGKLVLMDEVSGEVVGELPNPMRIQEDPALAAQAKGADGKPAPVMLELPEDVYDAYTGAGTSVVPYAEPSTELDEAREIFVRAIAPEDQDWMTKSATLISHAISSSTSLLLGGLTHATNYYINHSAPAPTPKDGTPPPPPPRALLLLSHPRTQQTLSRAYAISGQAVKVSQKTVGIVENIIGRAVGAKDKGKSTPIIRAPQPTPQAPPLAPRPIVQSPESDTPPPYPASVGGGPPLPPRRSPATTPGPPLPPRSKSPLPPNDKSASVPGSVPSTVTSSPQVPPPPPSRLRTRDKLALSANLVLATIDDSIHRAVDVGSERAAAVVGHKYGPEAGRSTALAAHTARNVTLVYIDARGFARKALIKKAGKTWLKAHVGSRGGASKETSGMVVDRQETDGQRR